MIDSRWSVQRHDGEFCFTQHRCWIHGIQNTLNVILLILIPRFHGGLATFDLDWAIPYRFTIQSRESSQGGFKNVFPLLSQLSVALYFVSRTDRNIALANSIHILLYNSRIVASALAVPVIRTVPGRSTGTGGAATKTGSTGSGAIRPARTSCCVGPCLGPLFGRRPAPNSR